MSSHLKFTSLISTISPKVAPVNESIDIWNPTEKLCMKCYEGQASKRKCCNAIYCDHCYTKDKKCPNCDKATRMEKMTGATFTLNVFSEHEECRICLDPGLKRRCCGNYYCDDCYYSQPKCRSCRTDVGRRNFDIQWTRATMISVFLGWLVTIFVVASVVGLFVTIVTSEAQTPKGLWGYKCYGFFRTCNMLYCVEMNSTIANGTIALPELASWESCNLDSLVKLESYGCVFDQQMYQATGGRLGYDVCSSDFPNGLYVFEDTFENWKNETFNSNLMKSSIWSSISNGFPTDYCGVPSHYGGKYALTFSGSLDRSATTDDLDMSSGGRVEAEMLIAPLDFDISHPYCKSAYTSYVTLDYSTNKGETWTTFATFNAFSYRSSKYFNVKVVIPDAAKTRSTRFRFFQYEFEAARDNWAIDNVRILRDLPTNYKHSRGFLYNLHETYRQIKLAQCCYDTDWCKSRLSIHEMEECKKYSWYDQSRPNYKFREVELFVFIVFIINLIKFVYITIQDWYMRHRVPFEDELRELFSFEYIYKYLPPHLRPRRTLSDYTSDVHMAARLDEQIKDAFKDEEGEGQIVLRKEEAERLKREKREQLRKEKKKLRERMKNKNFQLTFIESQKRQKINVDDNNGDEEDDDEKDQEEEDPFAGFVSNEIATSTDKLKRQNLAISKIAFDTRTSTRWTEGFAMITIMIFLICFFYKMIITAYFALHQTVYPYGLAAESITMTSAAIILFSMYNDIKEIYYTIKNIIPCRKRWIPYVTVDLTEDVQCLFVGRNTFPMDHITEAQAFSKEFIYLCAASLFIACFPWSLFSQIIRDEFLYYNANRIISPMIGIFTILRAVLGPTVIIKMAFSLEFILSGEMKIREAIGSAIQSKKSLIGAGIASFSFAAFAAFITSAIYLPLTGIAFGLSFAFGLFYGCFSGCYHSLPIRPLMYVTTLDSGVWLRVRKKEKCSCARCGKCCTELHATDEMMVVFTHDDVRFLNIMKNGMSTGS